MSFLRNISPTGAIGDFISVYRDAGKNRWWIAALAALATFSVFSLVIWESWKKERFLPEVTYITTFPADWTEAERKAFVAENQRRKDARAAEAAENDAAGRKMWKAVGRVSGIDVDTIDRQAQAERAAKEAADSAAAAALIERGHKAAPDPQ